MAALHDAGETRVVYRHRVLDPAFATETEAHLRPFYLYMLPAQCGQPIGTVLACVFIVADADQGPVQQMHYGGQYLAPAQLGGTQIAFHAFS